MPGASPTRPTPTSQLTGSALSQSNCTYTCGTMAEHRASVGRYRHGPDALRADSTDQVGGSTYSEVAAAVAKATGGKVILEPSFDHTRSEVRDYAAGGRGFAIGIDCSVTAGTTRRTGGYRGRHSVYVNRYVWRPASSTACSCERLTTVAHAEFDVCDPGKFLQAATTFMRWSAALLYKAAEAHGGGGVGSPVIALMLTRDTEGVTRTAVEPGSLYADATTSAKVLTTFTAGHPFTVSRTADGGSWTTDSGAVRKNWHRATGTTVTGWAKGRVLQ